LKNIEPRLIEHISNDIMEKDPSNVRWSDIGTSANSKLRDQKSILGFRAHFGPILPFFLASTMFTQGDEIKRPLIGIVPAIFCTNIYHLIDGANWSEFS
jgi:hypothetical protein